MESKTVTKLGAVSRHAAFVLLAGSVVGFILMSSMAVAAAALGR